MTTRKKRARSSDVKTEEPSASRQRSSSSSSTTAYMTNEEIANASKPLKLKDKWLLIPEYLRVKGLVRQHIESFNHFLTHKIAKIIETNNEVKSTVDPQFFVRYVGVRVGTPSMEVQFDEQMITPTQCRLQDLTYAAPIYVDVHYRRGHKIISKRDVRIGWVPIMLKSIKCVLTGKSESELAKLAECPLDPGGYFICKGNEKVIQIQEQIAHNRLIVEKDTKKGGYMAVITSNSHAKKSRANCSLTTAGKVYFKHNTLGQEVPIVIMLKALGATSDVEVLQLIAPENPELADILAPCFEECRDEGVETQEQALEWIGKKIRAAKLANEGGRRWTRMGTDPVLEAREVISTVVLPHIPAPSFCLREKKFFVALMARKVMMAKLDPDHACDDKDYYGNKQLNLAGFMIGLLFEDLLQKFNTSLQVYADKVLAKPNRAEQFDALKSIREDIITNGFVQSINTGNWNLKRFRLHKVGVTQVLTRLSYISALAHVTKIQSQFEKTRKVSGPRALQPSQWGMLCPSDTPEGETCGLAKNLALLAHITTEVEQQPVMDLAYTLGVTDASILTGEEMYSSSCFMVIINGRIIGVHRFPTRFATDMRQLRRCGLLDPFVSVQVHDGHRCVYIYCDGGRICRPLLLVNQNTGRPLLNQSHIDEIKNKSRDFPSLVSEGLVEFLDVSEENDCFIAIDQTSMDEEQAKKRTTRDPSKWLVQHTHMEIDPMTILGVVSGLIPYPHHNQSPRNTYQCAMGKQAIGTIGYNQYQRLDTLLHLMVYPQSPMVKTRVIDLIHFDDLPAGQNAIVAVMSYSGYDIEDAVVLNKASVDRGYGRCIVLKKFMTSLKSYPNSTKDRIREMADGDGSMVLETQKKKLSALEMDGICAVGGTVAPGSTLVRKEMPKNTTDTNVGGHFDDPSSEQEYMDSPLKYKSPEGGPDGVVDKVLVTKNKDDTTIIKILMRQTRRPELGDKFSSRHGQKGVVGIIVPQQNMPFNDQGICPDMIMNPHGFPSRMTVAKMIELIGGKGGVLCGKKRYATAFGEDQGPTNAISVEDCCATLREFGYNYAGKDILTDGCTGKPLNAFIFMGPVYYQKLKHMVLDKMHGRPRGPRAQLTRQPTEGRARDGGLRLGEMERDCLIGYGASSLLLERLMYSSDVYDATVCQTCGLLSYPGKCTYCENIGLEYELTTIKMPYAAKLLFQELQAMNIVPKVTLTKA